MKKRKPVLFLDDSPDSQKAITLFDKAQIPFVRYHIKQFEESCCADVPTTTTPSVFAPEGVYKGLENIKKYIEFRKNTPNYDEIESKSAYW